MENNLQLVKAARQGDVDSFAELYRSVYKDLYRFALYTLRNRADAEDVVSETVADAFASIRSLRSEEAFPSWIFRILANKCKNKLREYSRKHVELNEETGGMAQEKDLTENLLVRRAFLELSGEERLIVGMHVFGGYTSREIAAILHRNHNTIRTKESRALKKMAGKLEAWEVQHEG